MRIFEKTSFSFLAKSRMAIIGSLVIIAIGLVALLTRGLELGIDFVGGSEFVVSTTEEIPVERIRAALTPVFGAEPEVKRFDNDVLVRTIASSDDMEVLRTSVVATLESIAPGSNPRLIRSDLVGPRFANDLRQGAIYAVLASLLVIFIYISFRFEWRYSVGALAALFHDVFITLGLFALLHHLLPFSLAVDQAFIAAMLTIVGYSINDTVVIFDRIRENVQARTTEKFDVLVDRSINETLSRTIITSGTTLLTLLVLFIFAGDSLRGFAFALMVGILVGTYSTIFIASPVMVYLRKRYPVKTFTRASVKPATP